jgi:hypothetical protein
MIRLRGRLSSGLQCGLKAQVNLCGLDSFFHRVKPLA